MATTWLWDGGDATGGLEFLSGTSTTGTGAAVSIDATTFHTGTRAFKTFSGTSGVAHGYVNGVLADAGRRIDFWVNGDLGTLTTSTALIAAYTSGGALVFSVDAMTNGNMFIRNGDTSTLGAAFVVGLAGAGNWNRLTISYVITSTTSFTIKVYLNGVLKGTRTNADATLTRTGSNRLALGCLIQTPGVDKSFYFDDVYVDDGTGLDDPGAILVTNKKPAATNTNSFDTLIGSATNRWDYVAEVPLSEAKGIQHAAATDVQENFGLQAASAGDVDISVSTLIARTAWAWAKRGARTDVAHRASAASGSSNPTTSMTITIPASTATNDLLFVSVTSRGHTSGDALPSVTDDDTGGNTWAQVDGSTDRKATLWWKRATSASASKTVTVSGCITSCAGGIQAISGGLTSGTPYADVTVETNASADETHAGFTPTAADSFVCFAVFNYDNDNAVTTVAGATLGALTSRFEHLSNPSGVNNDSGNTQWSALSSGGPTGTGNITWSQANGTTYSIAWTVKPQDVPAADLMDNGSETAIALTTTSALYTKITDSASYPSNAAGIGLRSTGTTADTFLYECGTLIAYVPLTVTPIAGTETFGAALSEASAVAITAWIAGTETLALLLSEAVTLFAVLDRPDTLAVALTEAGSLASTSAVSDALAVGLEDTASPLVSASAADTLAVVLSDAGIIAAVIDLVDTLAVALTETAALAASSDVSDTLAVVLDDASANDLTSAAIDDLAVALSEAATLAASSDVSDTFSVALSEAASLDAVLAVTDTIAVALDEASTNLGLFALSDDLAVALSETSENLGVFALSDTLAVALTETADLAAMLDVFDTLAVVFDETGAVDAQGGGATPIDGTDTLPVALVETSALAAFSDLTETFAVGLAETTDLAATSAVTDTLEIGLDDTATVAAMLDQSDDLAVAVTETSALLAEIAETESLELGLLETATLDAASTVADDLAVVLDEAATLDAASTVVDDLAIVLDEVAELLAALDVADAIAVVLDDVSSIEATGIFTVDASDVLAVALSETADLLDTLILEGLDDLAVVLEDLGAVVTEEAPIPPPPPISTGGGQAWVSQVVEVPRPRPRPSGPIPTIRERRGTDRLPVVVGERGEVLITGQRAERLEPTALGLRDVGTVAATSLRDDRLLLVVEDHGSVTIIFDLVRDVIAPDDDTVLMLVAAME